MSERFQILVVDDNETNVEILSRIIQSLGYETLVAYDGQFALQLAQEFSLDLILLDVLLPDTSGFEVAEKLKSHPKTREIPILFVSALHDSAHIVQGLETGAVDYIPKPFQEREIIARIQTQIQLRKLEREKFRLLRILKADLDLAKSNQENLVSYHFPPSPHYRVFTSYNPMEEVGGDLITYEHSSHGELDIFFGDVSGHGVSAGMVSLMSIISFKNINRAFLTPKECLHWMHDNMKNLIQTHFISCTYLRYNPEKRLLSYSMAGHPPMALLRGDTITSLGTKGFCLLMFPELVLESKEIYLQPGDRLFLYSDGMYEVPDAGENYLVEPEFLKGIAPFVQLPAEEFLKRAQNFSLSFGTGRIQDDMTMLLLELTS